MAETINENEEVIRDAKEAQAVGDKIAQAVEGHTIIAVMGALSVQLAEVLLLGELEGVAAHEMFSRFAQAVAGVLASKRLPKEREMQH